MIDAIVMPEISGNRQPRTREHLRLFARGRENKQTKQQQQQNQTNKQTKTIKQRTSVSYFLQIKAYSVTDYVQMSRP